MTTFLFWNIGRKPLQAIVARLASHYQLDVVMVAESNASPESLLRALNSLETSKYFYVEPSACSKVHQFVRFPTRFVRPLPGFETDRTAFRHLVLPGLVDILMVLTHLPSKRDWTESSQTAGAHNLAERIRQAERTVGHSRTLLVGDLNMNPFEDGVVNANGLHGVMSRRIAEQGCRKVQGISYPFFYNPMWSLFGDWPHDPPGTYYYRGSEHKAFFWSMFDQLLIRPELLDRFGNSDLEIVLSDGKVSFLSASGVPNATIVSDHLPILFRLSL